MVESARRPCSTRSLITVDVASLDQAQHNSGDSALGHICQRYTRGLRPCAVVSQDGRQHIRQALRSTDAYMDLFVDELNHMYISGAWMWDAHLKETFLFKAKLFATVCDWPGGQNAQPCAAQHYHMPQGFARCMVSCIMAACGHVSAAKCVADTSAGCIGWCNRSLLLTISDH